MSTGIYHGLERKSIHSMQQEPAKQGGYYPTHHEIQVMRMMAEEIPWQQGACTNACVEFLQGAGYATRSGNLTMKGALALDEIKMRGLNGEA